MFISRGHPLHLSFYIHRILPKNLFSQFYYIDIIVDILSYIDISDENPGPPRCDDVIRPANNSTFYFCWMGPNDSKLLIQYTNHYDGFIYNYY